MFWRKSNSERKDNEGIISKIDKLTERIVFGLFVLVMLFILFGVMSEKVYENNDLEIIEGVFDEIEAGQPNGENTVSTYYDIRLEDNQKFRIAADYVDCFYASLFYQKMKKGDRILLRIPKKGNGFKINQTIVEVQGNNQVFMKRECYNQKVQKGKLIAPFIVLVAVGGMWYLRKRYFQREAAK